MKWDSSGSILASCSDDTTVKLWAVADSDADADAEQPQQPQQPQKSPPPPLFDLRGHGKEVYTIRWSPTGAGSANASKKPLLASASFDTTVRVWDPEAGKCLLTLRRHDKKVYTVAFSPDGDYLASGALGGQLHVWSVKDGSVVKSFRGECDIFEVAWDSTGSKLACCGGLAANDVTIVDFRV